MRWIRRRVGWIAAAAVGGFLLWLVATAATLQVTRAATVGTLFGRPVSADAIQKAFQAATHDAILSYGDRVRDQTSDEELMERAWERLTLLEEARGRRVQVSDQEVVEQLRNLPLFQTSDGRFDSRSYQEIVQYTLGTTPRQFEEETRQNLTIRKLLQEAIEVPPVTDAEIQEAFRREQTSIRATLLEAPDADMAREIIPSVRQDPTRMEAYARRLGVSLQATPLFKRSESLEGLGVAGSAFAALFDMEPGGVSGPLSSPKGWLLARLEEKQANAEASPGEDDQKRLREEIASRKRLTATLAWYQDLLKRADRKTAAPPNSS